VKPIPTSVGEQAILEFKDQWAEGQQASHPVQEGKLLLSWLAVVLRSRLSVEAAEIGNVSSPPERPYKQFLGPIEPPADIQELFDRLCGLDDKLFRTYLRACDLYHLATQVMDDRPSLANFLLVSSIECLGTIVTPGDGFGQSFLKFVRTYCPKTVLGERMSDAEWNGLLSKIYEYRSQYAHGGKDVPVAALLADKLGLPWVKHFVGGKEEPAPSVSWFESVVHASLVQFLRAVQAGPPPERKRQKIIELALSSAIVHLRARRPITQGQLLTKDDIELQ